MASGRRAPKHDSSTGWVDRHDCPDEIRARIPGRTAWPGKEPPLFATMADVHEALTSCPDVRGLSVRVAVRGCSEWPDLYNFPFDLAGGDYYPVAMRTLALEGYHFAARERESARPTTSPSTLEGLYRWVISGRARNWLRWSFLPREQRDKTNLELWLDAMDFSQIHTLSLKGLTRGGGDVNLLTELLVPELKGLKALDVERGEMQDFILALPADTLANLTWLYSERPLAPVLDRHGQSLRRLEWRTPESMSGTAPMLTPGELRALGAKAPQLRDLTVDIKRNGTTWPWETLRALASSLLSLTNLTIYLEISSDCERQKSQRYNRDYCLGPCRGEAQYAQPLLNRTTATEVFGFLRAHKAGEALAHVTLRAGDWSRSWDGPLYMPPWIEGKTAWAECGDHRPEPCWGEDTVVENECESYLGGQRAPLGLDDVVDEEFEGWARTHCEAGQEVLGY